MKRGNKLLLLSLVLVVLLAAVLLVSRLNPEETGDTTERTYNDVVFSLDPEKVTNFSWDYSDEAAFTKTADGWVYDADEAFPVNEDQLYAMLRILSSVGASKIIENVQDLDQYGLQYPFCDIRVTVDGKTWSLAIGDQNTISGDRYFSTGDGNVYMVSDAIASYFNFGPEGAMLLEQIPDLSGITGLKLESAEQSYEILYAYDTDKTYSRHYRWFMDGKVADTELTQALLQSVQTMQWNSCVDYNATDLSLYGLDNPAVLTATYGSENFVLELGDQVEKGTYARIADSHMVYLINTSLWHQWSRTTYSEMMPDEVLAMDWDTVTAMDITWQGKTYTLTGELPEGTTLRRWMREGKDVDIITLTNRLNNMGSAGYATDLTPTLDEEVRFLFYRDADHHAQVELVLYQYDDTTCLVTLDGESTVLAKRTDLVLLLDAVEDLVTEA